MFIYVMIALCVFFMICHYSWKKWKRFQGLPKGPTGLPFLGHILQLGFTPHLTLSKWAAKFGKTYTLDLFGKPILVINETRTMREILSIFEATGKCQLVILDVVHGAEHGIANTEGNVWMQQNKFLLQNLRKFGFRGSNKLNNALEKECNELCSWIDQNLKQNTNRTLCLGKAFLNSVTNIVWNTITGEDKRKEDNSIVEILETLMQNMNQASVLTFMPWLRHIAPGLSGYTKLVETSNKLHKAVENKFIKHKQARKVNSNLEVGNTIDAYLEKVENCTDPTSTFYGENGLKHSFFAVVNFLVAGSETTASSLHWLIHYLLAHPDKQAKLQEEVDAALEENPDQFDKSRMPYLEAVILEVLRMSSLLPLGIIHKLLNNVCFQGTILPKGLFLLANLYHVNNDPKTWKDPECFKPERFLEGSEAERRRLRENVVTFQEGRRKCPGEPMAKEMLSVFTFRLVQNYSFHRDEKRTDIEYLKPMAGFLLLPPKLEVVVRRRKLN